MSRPRCARDDAEQARSFPDITSLPRGNPLAATPASHSGWKPLPELTYDGFQSPAVGPASGRVSPEPQDAIVTISAWS